MGGVNLGPPCARGGRRPPRSRKARCIVHVRIAAARGSRRTDGARGHLHVCAGDARPYNGVSAAPALPPAGPSCVPGDPALKRLPIPICALALTLAMPAHAHLLLTEVGYDPVDETGATGEFVEILNPGTAAVSLANVWLVNDPEAYPLLVNGPIASGITLNDFVYRFPPIALDPGRVIVVCHDSDAFLAEHFGGGPLSDFTGQPGQPLLVEITDDGEGDGVPAMIGWGSNPTGTLSMANNGECVGLATWDGVSDRVQDIDWVCWLTLAYLPDKDFDYPFGIDGPDPDLDPSFFPNDAGSAVAAPDAPQGSSVHRTSLAETGEVASGGNGLSGHDETTEDWSSWVVAAPTPGRTDLALVAVEPGGRPDAPRLLGAFPNPARGAAAIRFAIPAPGRVSLAVFDAQGRRVAVVADAPFSAGMHRVTWDGRAGDRPARAGLYFIRLDCGGVREAAPLVLVR